MLRVYTSLKQAVLAVLRIFGTSTVYEVRHEVQPIYHRVDRQEVESELAVLQIEGLVKQSQDGKFWSALPSAKGITCL